MSHLKFSVVTLVLFLLAAVSFSSGCTKSSLRMLPAFLGGDSKDEGADGPQAVDEINAAIKNMGSASSKAGTLTIWHDSFEDAQIAAAKTGKPILADFTGSNWCHWCVKLKEDVFEKNEFKEWARDNVILLELDYPRGIPQPPEIKEQNAELAKRYNIKGYPTVLLLSPEGEILGKLGHNSDVSKWVQTASEILKR